MTPPITPEMLEQAREYSLVTGERVEAVLVRMQQRQMAAAGTLPTPPPPVDLVTVDVYVESVRDAMARFVEKMYDVLAATAAVLREFDKHVEAALRPTPKRRRVTRCRSHGTDLDAGGRCPLCERRRR